MDKIIKNIILYDNNINDNILNINSTLFRKENIKTKTNSENLIIKFKNTKNLFNFLPFFFFDYNMKK